MSKSSEDSFDPRPLLSRCEEATPAPGGEVAAPAPDSWEAASASIAAAQAATIRAYSPEILAYRRVAHGSLSGDPYYIVDVWA